MPQDSAVDEINRIVNEYGDMLYRLCLIMLCVPADAEDAVQETFIAYFRNSPEFASDEHRKAWLITVARNKCRSMLRFRKRHYTLSDEVLETIAQDDGSKNILEALVNLPDKFRTVLSLHYIEGYKVNEIAEIIGKSPSAVKMRLSKGRELLEKKYKEEFL